MVSGAPAGLFQSHVQQDRRDGGACRQGGEVFGKGGEAVLEFEEVAQQVLPGRVVPGDGTGCGCAAGPCRKGFFVAHGIQHERPGGPRPEGRRGCGEPREGSGGGENDEGRAAGGSSGKGVPDPGCPPIVRCGGETTRRRVPPIGLDARGDRRGRLGTLHGREACLDLGLLAEVLERVELGVEG